MSCHCHRPDQNCEKCRGIKETFLSLSKNTKREDVEIPLSSIEGVYIVALSGIECFDIISVHKSREEAEKVAFKERDIIIKEHEDSVKYAEENSADYNINQRKEWLAEILETFRGDDVDEWQGSGVFPIPVIREIKLLP